MCPSTIGDYLYHRLYKKKEKKKKVNKNRFVKQTSIK